MIVFLLYQRIVKAFPETDSITRKTQPVRDKVYLSGCVNFIYSLNLSPGPCIFIFESLLSFLSHSALTICSNPLIKFSCFWVSMNLKNAKNCITIGPKLYEETVYAGRQSDPRAGKCKGILIISTNPKTGLPKGKTGPNFNTCFKLIQTVSICCVMIKCRLSDGVLIV